GLGGLAPGLPLLPCADLAARPDLRREWVTTTRGRLPGPLAGSVGRRGQVRWCLLHPHLLDLREPTTARDPRSRHRNPSLLPRWGARQALCSRRALPSAQPRTEHGAPRAAQHVEPERAARAPKRGPESPPPAG